MNRAEFAALTQVEFWLSVANEQGFVSATQQAGTNFGEFDPEALLLKSHAQKVNSQLCISTTCDNHVTTM